MSSEEGDPMWTTLGDDVQLGDEVWVTEPMNHGEGKITYLVSSGAISIRRRYSDFQWLYNRIMTELPGSFIPIIPHKRTLGKKDLDEEFLETRRTNLERFLKGVYEVPESKTASASLRLFMIAEDIEAAKKTVEASHPSLSPDDEPNEDQEAVEKVKKGITNLLAKAVTVTQTKLGNVELKQTKEEQDIEALKEYVVKMEGHVKELQASSQVVMQTTTDKALAFGSMAAPIADWKFSRDEYFGADTEWTKPMGNLMIKTAQVSQEVDNTLQQQHIAEKNKLGLGLQTLALDVQALRKALKTRKQLQVLFTTRGKQITDKEQAIQNPGKRDVNKLKQELRDFERSSASVGQTLQDCSERLIRESERILPELEERLRNLMVGFAKAQIEYSAKIQKSWEFVVALNEKNNGGEIAEIPRTPTPTKVGVPEMPSAPPPPEPTE